MFSNTKSSIEIESMCHNYDYKKID